MKTDELQLVLKQIMYTYNQNIIFKKQRNALAGDAMAKATCCIT